MIRTLAAVNPAWTAEFAEPAGQKVPTDVARARPRALPHGIRAARTYPGLEDMPMRTADSRDTPTWGTGVTDRGW